MLVSFVKKYYARSVSSLVRAALEDFDLKSFDGAARQHRQISVRLPSDLKADLTISEKVSAGELVRSAIVVI